MRARCNPTAACFFHPPVNPAGAGADAASLHPRVPRGFLTPVLLRPGRLESGAMAELHLHALPADGR
jgi:hypothetical protein